MADTRSRWLSKYRRTVMLIATLLIAASMLALPAQGPSSAQTSSQAEVEGTVSGQVFSSLGKPVSGAVVRLESPNAATLKTITDGSGRFTFSNLRIRAYTVTAEKSGLLSHSMAIAWSDRIRPDIHLVLDAAQKTPSDSPTAPSSDAMEFSDKPDFTVAGVTDWTAVGGHGSDSTLRTSEDLTRETLTLKAPGAEPGAPAPGSSDGRDDAESRLRAALTMAPRSYAANHDLGEYYLRAGKYQQAMPLLQVASAINHKSAGDEYDLALACRGLGDLLEARRHIRLALAQKDTADAHRVEGELDEKLGDPLAAVQQEERAARLDPSEENYFVWGSELLLHRAVWQAVEVFKDGAKAHRASARLLTALGTALFAGALYDEAAQRLCEASDLQPADSQPYIFMGKIERAAPSPLPCVMQKLERFAQRQPDSATANYLYAMSLYKRAGHPDLQRVETLLTKAVTLDPKCADAYLQLGIISFAKRDYPKAVAYYTSAIKADPTLGEAHYRLGVAYDRTGEPARAKREFQLHDELDKAQADAVERQRREVKQFLVVLQGQPSYPKK